MSVYLQKYLHELVSIGGYYAPPESTGRDGYECSLKGVSIFISNKVFSESEAEAIRLRTGFIKGDILYYLPNDEDLKYKRFCEHVKFLLELKSK